MSEQHASDEHRQAAAAFDAQRAAISKGPDPEHDQSPTSVQDRDSDVSKSEQLHDLQERIAHLFAAADGTDDQDAMLQQLTELVSAYEAIQAETGGPDDIVASDAVDTSTSDSAEQAEIASDVAASTAAGPAAAQEATLPTTGSAEDAEVGKASRTDPIPQEAAKPIPTADTDAVDRSHTEQTESDEPFTEEGDVNVQVTPGAELPSAMTTESEGDSPTLEKGEQILPEHKFGEAVTHPMPKIPEVEYVEADNFYRVSKESARAGNVPLLDEVIGVDTPQGRKVYGIKELLGTGAIALAYRAEADDESSVVLKIPNVQPDADEAQLKKLLGNFYTEATILRHLAEHDDGTRYFPRVFDDLDSGLSGRIAGMMRNAPKRYYSLAMEYVPESYTPLSDTVVDYLGKPPHLREEALMPIIRKIVHSFAVLERAGVRVIDKKTPDYYFNEAGDMKVLDFNVASAQARYVTPDSLTLWNMVQNIFPETGYWAGRRADGSIVFNTARGGDEQYASFEDIPGMTEYSPEAQRFFEKLMTHAYREPDNYVEMLADIDAVLASHEVSAKADAAAANVVEQPSETKERYEPIRTEDLPDAMILEAVEFMQKMQEADWDTSKKRAVIRYALIRLRHMTPDQYGAVNIAEERKLFEAALAYDETLHQQLMGDVDSDFPANKTRAYRQLIELAEATDPRSQSHFTAVVLMTSVNEMMRDDIVNGDSANEIFGRDSADGFQFIVRNSVKMQAIALEAWQVEDARRKAAAEAATDGFEATIPSDPEMQAVKPGATAEVGQVADMAKTHEEQVERLEPVPTNELPDSLKAEADLFAQKLVENIYVDKETAVQYALMRLRHMTTDEYAAVNIREEASLLDKVLKFDEDLHEKLMGNAESNYPAAMIEAYRKIVGLSQDLSSGSEHFTAVVLLANVNRPLSASILSGRFDTYLKYHGESSFQEVIGSSEKLRERALTSWRAEDARREAMFDGQELVPVAQIELQSIRAELAEIDAFLAKVDETIDARTQVLNKMIQEAVTPEDSEVDLAHMSGDGLVKASGQMNFDNFRYDVRQGGTYKGKALWPLSDGGTRSVHIAGDNVIKFALDPVHAWTEEFTRRRLEQRGVTLTNEQQAALPEVIEFGSVKVGEHTVYYEVCPYYEALTHDKRDMSVVGETDDPNGVAASFTEVLSAVDINKRNNWAKREDGSLVVIDFADWAEQTLITDIARMVKGRRALLESLIERAESDPYLMKILLSAKRKALLQRGQTSLDPLVVERALNHLEHTLPVQPYAYALDDTDLSSHNFTRENILERLGEVHKENVKNAMPWVPDGNFTDLPLMMARVRAYFEGKTVPYLKAIRPDQLTMLEGMQYKVTKDGEVVNTRIQGSSWDHALGGAMVVWRNPADDQSPYYVVNGHHRYEYLSRLQEQPKAVNVVELSLEYLQDVGLEGLLAQVDLDNPDDVKLVGAILNLQEGRGTKQDTLAFLLDHPEVTPELVSRLDLEANKQIHYALAIKTLPEPLIAFALQQKEVRQAGVGIERFDTFAVAAQSALERLTRVDIPNSQKVASIELAQRAKRGTKPNDLDYEVAFIRTLHLSPNVLEVLDNDDARTLTMSTDKFGYETHNQLLGEKQSDFSEEVTKAYSALTEEVKQIMGRPWVSPGTIAVLVAMSDEKLMVRAMQTGFNEAFFQDLTAAEIKQALDWSRETRGQVRTEWKALDAAESDGDALPSSTEGMNSATPMSSAVEDESASGSQVESASPILEPLDVIPDTLPGFEISIPKVIPSIPDNVSFKLSVGFDPHIRERTMTQKTYLDNLQSDLALSTGPRSLGPLGKYKLIAALKAPLELVPFLDPSDQNRPPSVVATHKLLESANEAVAAQLATFVHQLAESRPDDPVTAEELATAAEELWSARGPQSVPERLRATLEALTDGAIGNARAEIDDWHSYLSEEYRAIVEAAIDWRRPTVFVEHFGKLHEGNAVLQELPTEAVSALQQQFPEWKLEAASEYLSDSEHQQHRIFFLLSRNPPYISVMKLPLSAHPDRAYRMEMDSMYLDKLHANEHRIVTDGTVADVLGDASAYVDAGEVTIPNFAVHGSLFVRTRYLMSIDRAMDSLPSNYPEQKMRLKRQVAKDVLSLAQSVLEQGYFPSDWGAAVDPDHNIVDLKGIGVDPDFILEAAAPRIRAYDIDLTPSKSENAILTDHMRAVLGIPQALQNMLGEETFSDSYRALLYDFEVDYTKIRRRDALCHLYANKFKKLREKIELE